MRIARQLKIATLLVIALALHACGPMHNNAHDVEIVDYH